MRAADVAADVAAPRGPRTAPFMTTPRGFRLGSGAGAAGKGRNRECQVSCMRPEHQVCLFECMLTLELCLETGDALQAPLSQRPLQGEEQFRWSFWMEPLFFMAWP